MKWYYELDLEGNTFLSDRGKLIGYDDLLDDVLYSVVSGNMVFIQGEEGSGKTAILRRVIKKFRGKGKVAYINAAKLEKELNVEEVISKKYGFLSRLLGKKMKDMILLVDEVDSLSERNNERIKYFFDNNYVRSVIFTGHDYKRVGFTQSMKDRIRRVVKLNGINEDYSVDVLRDRLEGNTEVISDEAIKLIFRQSKCIKNFLENADKVFTYVFEELKEKVITEEHVEAALSAKIEVPQEKPKKVEKKSSEKKAVKRVEEPILVEEPKAEIVFEEPEIKIGTHKKEGLSEVQKKYNEQVEKASKEKKDVAEEYY